MYFPFLHFFPLKPFHLFHSFFRPSSPSSLFPSFLPSTTEPQFHAPVSPVCSPLLPLYHSPYSILYRSPSPTTIPPPSSHTFPLLPVPFLFFHYTFPHFPPYTSPLFLPVTLLSPYLSPPPSYPLPSSHHTSLLLFLFLVMAYLGLATVPSSINLPHTAHM